MPKMKTHRGAAKRFKMTATGKIRRRHAYRDHLLEKKAFDPHPPARPACRSHRRRSQAAGQALARKVARSIDGHA